MTAEPSIRLLPDLYPDCKCGHDRRAHNLLRGACFVSRVCSCKVYRPRVVVA